ncbi:MAG: type II toxin-antitoxin system Phd/YefM family antitoxin [Candidatus Electrothrix sp. AR4]|nr:type II toxin-antitoxin system Phd/YefM family antitoxin [Candidatus Electrothrix sp. AR4]
MKLNPQLIKKKGKGEFVVLPVEEFQAMTDLIEKYEDLRDLRAAEKISRIESNPDTRGDRYSRFVEAGK